jgi:hypothetical protein
MPPKYATRGVRSIAEINEATCCEVADGRHIQNHAARRSTMTQYDDSVPLERPAR